MQTVAGEPCIVAVNTAARQCVTGAFCLRYSFPVSVSEPCIVAVNTAAPQCSVCSTAAPRLSLSFVLWP